MRRSASAQRPAHGGGVQYASNRLSLPPVRRDPGLPSQGTTFPRLRTSRRFADLALVLPYRALARIKTALHPRRLILTACRHALRVSELLFQLDRSTWNRRRSLRFQNGCGASQSISVRSRAYVVWHEQPDDVVVRGLLSRRLGIALRGQWIMSIT